MACFKLMLKTLKRLQQASAHSVINYRKKLTNLRNWFILKNSKERNFTFPVGIQTMNAHLLVHLVLLTHTDISLNSFLSLYLLY